MLKNVVTNYTNADFPLDSLWSDIDYMHKYRDFTYNKNGSYSGLDDFVENVLHKNNKKYVPIIDAGVAIVKDGSYPAFESGKQAGAFIMSGNGVQNGTQTDGILYGKVWPGFAAFTDHTKKEANEWWIKQLHDFQQELKFDGLWLDMNEAANF